MDVENLLHKMELITHFVEFFHKFLFYFTLLSYTRFIKAPITTRRHLLAKQIFRYYWDCFLVLKILTKMP